MEFRQTIGSDKLISLFNLPAALRDRKVEVIILPAESNARKEPKGNACKIGCCSNLPELPDSFFEPLPEEDLQAWGM
ncbi:MAG: hypothetical protein LBI36_07840 [Oscillospiraceae bacterium]|jgi:hypothetical protein|nr:hypothetical protein [Oscillospiraceae bacterium]